MQRSPGVDVDVTEVGLQPDLLANAREPLVDKEVFGGRASSRCLFEHLGGVQDAGNEAVVALWKRMAENRCEELGGEVVDGELGRKSEAIDLDGSHVVSLVVEVAVGGHVDGVGFDVMVQELLTSGD